MDDDREQRARELLGAANNGAAALSGGFLRFVPVAVYVGITLASTTDEQLVRGTAVTLPWINTSIPITGVSGFCTLAPVLIFILHLSLLVQLANLRTAVIRLDVALSKLTSAQRASVADQLATPYYIRFLTSEIGSGAPGSALALLATMVVLPLFLLVSIQVRFQPLHDAFATGFQQFVVATDVVVALAILWGPLSRRSASRDVTSPRSALVRGVSSPWTLALVLGAVTIAASIIANTPLGRERGGWLSQRQNLDLEGKMLSEDRLFAEQINALQDGTPAQREDILRKVSRLSVLQGRDLRYASLRRAVLPAVDLRSRRDRVTADLEIATVLEKADLSWAVMQQTLLDDVNLRQATLEGVHLQGGILVRANLEGADLSGAELQEAKLSAAKLRAAKLRGAMLTGSDLSRADLRDADLSGVHAPSAMLRETDLRGADLTGADLRGADLSRAHLQGTNLAGAQLDGAIVQGVVVRDVFGRPCKLRHGSALASTTEQLVFEGCRARHVVGPTCGEDVEAVAALLVGLACEDAYVARGLSTQVLYDAPDRRPVARALTKAGSDETCAGVRLLSERVRADLAARR